MLVARGHEEHARAGQIRRDVDRGQRNVADAGVAHFARYQRRQDALHLAFDAGEALGLRTHPRALLNAARHFDAGVALDLVADTYVLVVLHADAALRARA